MGPVVVAHFSLQCSQSSHCPWGSVEDLPRADQGPLTVVLAQREEAGEGGNRSAAESPVDCEAGKAEATAQRIERALQAANRDSGEFHFSCITK